MPYAVIIQFVHYKVQEGEEDDRRFEVYVLDHSKKREMIVLG